MKALNFMSGMSAYLEFGHSSLRVVTEETGLELPLARQSNGRLSQACKERLVMSLEPMLRHKPWQPRPRVLCAVGARGVSLRRLKMPTASGENLQRLLRLQIESQFPLSPSELAWGYCAPNGKPASGNGQDLLVAAVKKEVLEDYSDIITQCGASPVFTLAALARGTLCQPPAEGSYALLDIGRDFSELLCFENGAPISVRVLPWGGESITQALAESLGLERDEAEKLKLRLANEQSSNGEGVPLARNAVETALDSLAEGINAAWKGDKLYLSGATAKYPDLPRLLANRLGSKVRCETLAVPNGEGRSAAVLGMQRTGSNGSAGPAMVLELNAADGVTQSSAPAPVKYIVGLAILGLTVLLLPYAEALLLKPRLAARLKSIKADAGRLAVIDRELDFLQYLKQNQPPYLDAVYTIAKSAAPGMKLEFLSMNRRGELSWRGTMQNSQAVTDFRSKLIDSGFFSSVTVEEQSPSPDRQKVSVRMNAQWKAFSSRQPLAIMPASEPEPPKGNKGPSPSGMPPGAMPPGPMPPGADSPAGKPGRNSPVPGKAGLPSGATMKLPPGVMPPGVMPPGASGDAPTIVISPGVVPPPEQPQENP
jgi:Tfp pilus assembly PilM family ATPase